MSSCSECGSGECCGHYLVDERDEARAERDRYRDALRAIAEHGPADDPHDPCWNVAQTARQALTLRASSGKAGDA